MVNAYFVFSLVFIIGFFVLDMVGSWLNVSALAPDLPSEFCDTYDAEEYAKSQKYTREKSRFGMIESVFSLLVLLAFWWAHGFGWLDDLVRDWVSDNELLAGLAFMSLLVIANHLLELPFELYHTFVIEEKYGFNKTTIGTFVSDQLKSMALMALLGLPLLAVILWVMERFGSSGWLYCWIIVTLFTLAMMYLAPTYIMPLFNKFKPLSDGELKREIESLSAKCEFPLTEVFEIDGSKRSTKSNAFFTGFGRNKKIALYDTLIQKHSVGELLAVLAHEIGHYKKKHIVQHVVLSISQMGVLFFLLGLFLNNEGLCAAFGVETPSVYCSLVFFFFLYTPISRLLSVVMMVVSRKNEYEADAYAADMTERPEDLIAGLKKLSKDNLANLTPHPFYVFLNYSHPPMLKRIAALQRLATQRA